MNCARVAAQRPPLCSVLVAALIFLTCLLRAPAGAEGLTQEQHSKWTGEDGAPQGVRALAQAPDGMLWLTTIYGVYSFDGRVFTRFDSPDPAIHHRSFRSPWFTREGDLWLQRLHGAPLRIHQGRVERLDHADCGAIDELGDLQEGPDGTIWAAMNEHDLVALGSDRIWHEIDLPFAGESSHLTKVHVDGRGTVWIVLDDRLYRRPLGRVGFLPTRLFVYGVNTFSDGLSGDIWIASSGPQTSRGPALHLQHVDAGGAALPAPHIKEELSSVVTDSDGSVWILTSGSVLAHLSGESLATNAPLTTAAFKDAVELRTAVQDEGSEALMRARDGAIWVGGLGGIERFAPAIFHPLLPEALPGLWDNCVEGTGTQWVKDPHDALLLVEPNGPLHKMPQTVEALYCSKAGTLFRNEEGLWTARGGSVARLPALPGLAGYSNHYIFTGAITTSGGTIFATAAGGAIGRSLWSYRSRQWTRVNLSPQLPEITAMYPLSDQEILLGLHDGSLALLRDGVIGSSTSTGLGGIIGIARVHSEQLVLGANGVALRSTHGVSTLKFAREDLVQRSTGATEARDGSLWLNAAEGIVRVPRAEWAAALKDPNHLIEASNVREGNLVGPSYPGLFSDRAQSDDEGRLWFSTLNGIVSVSPHTAFPNEAPMMIVHDVLGDGHPPSTNRDFAPDPGVISIHYTGIDYRNPTGLTYAYKLLGNDRDWQYVGSRTEAVYTHLGAGSYTFLVKARNVFGLWTAPVSLQPFSVEPHIYERTWFLLSCVALGAVSILGAVQLRLRAAALTARSRAEARADERVSIARDLHDTLLQGIQGLLLTLHAAAEKVPPEHESRQALERALISTERFVIQGRDRVKGLRALGLQGQDLGEAFTLVAEDMCCRDFFNISVHRPISLPKLSEQVQAEIFLIGREALLNACKHANASRIDVQLTYAAAQFSFECRDDGHGFDPGTVAAQDGDARFGLRGMTERAESIRASLVIESNTENGTLVQLQVRGSIAYER